jgi:putative polyhydroxyalkanoate system protein
MATIDVRRTHNLGLDGARKAAEQLAEKLKEKLEIRYRWEGNDLRFERTGANGRIQVGATEVRVEIDLAFLLKPMKGKVESKVHQYLDEALRPAT